MRGGETVGDLDGEIEDLIERHRLSFKRVLERLPFQQLHHDERLPFVLAEVVDGRQVRMIHCGEKLRLTMETTERTLLRDLTRWTSTQASDRRVQRLRCAH